MIVTITLEHWNKAKAEDVRLHRSRRIDYCPIAQCLTEAGFPNVHVRQDFDETYFAEYGQQTAKITGCASKVARTFDMESELPEDLLPCTFELPDAS